MLAAVGREAQLEARYDVVAETSVVEVGQAYGASVGCVVQLVLKPLLGPVVEDEHAVAVGLRLLLFG